MFVLHIKKLLTVVGVFGMFIMVCSVGEIDNVAGNDLISFAMSMWGFAMAVLSYLACVGIDRFFGITEIIYHDLYIWLDIMHKQDRLIEHEC